MKFEGSFSPSESSCALLLSPSFPSFSPWHLDLSCRRPFLRCPPLPWYFLPLPRPRLPRTSRTLASLEQHLLPSASSRAKVGLNRLCGLDSFTAALPEVKGPSCLHPGHPSHVHIHRYTVVSCLCNLSPRVSPLVQTKICLPSSKMMPAESLRSVRSTSPLPDSRSVSNRVTYVRMPLTVGLLPLTTHDHHQPRPTPCPSRATRLPFGDFMRRRSDCKRRG